MRIFIKTLGHKMLKLEVEPFESIEDVKRKIYEKEGIPIEAQRLRCCGVDLDDNSLLYDHLVVEDSVLFLVLFNAITPREKEGDEFRVGETKNRNDSGKEIIFGSIEKVKECCDRFIIFPHHQRVVSEESYITSWKGCMAVCDFSNGAGNKTPLKINSACGYEKLNDSDFIVTFIPHERRNENEPVERTIQVMNISNLEVIWEYAIKLERPRKRGKYPDSPISEDHCVVILRLNDEEFLFLCENWIYIFNINNERPLSKKEFKLSTTLCVSIRNYYYYTARLSQKRKDVFFIGGYFVLEKEQFRAKYQILMYHIQTNSYVGFPVRNPTGRVHTPSICPFQKDGVEYIAFELPYRNEIGIINTETSKVVKHVTKVWKQRGSKLTPYVPHVGAVLFREKYYVSISGCLLEVFEIMDNLYFKCICAIRCCEDGSTISQIQMEGDEASGYRNIYFTDSRFPKNKLCRISIRDRSWKGRELEDLKDRVQFLCGIIRVREEEGDHHDMYFQKIVVKDGVTFFMSKTFLVV